MPPSSPTWGTDEEVKPPGWGARVRRKWGDPLCTLSSGWPGGLEAINWFHSSCNEMEMKLPDRGALSWGRMVASSWAWTGSAPPALPTPPRPPEAAAPGAPWPRSRGRLRASVPRITARRGLRVARLSWTRVCLCRLWLGTRIQNDDHGRNAAAVARVVVRGGGAASGARAATGARAQHAARAGAGPGGGLSSAAPLLLPLPPHLRHLGHQGNQP